MATLERTQEARKTRCRYLRLSGEQCTAEALDRHADILVCHKHAGRVLQLLKTHKDRIVKEIAR